MTAPLEVEEVAAAVARALEQVGVEYALGGSVATSLQGEPRSTNDIDFAVRLSAPQAAPLVAALGPDFAVDEPSLLEAIEKGRSANIFHLPSMTKVDLFIRGGEPFDEMELSRRRPVRLRSVDLEISVASPEDNLLRKLRWFRLGGETSDRQWRDILGLLRISGGTMDMAYVERWARTLGVDDLLARARAAS